MIDRPPELPADEPVGALGAVAHFHDAMPTGVTVSHRGRIFVNYPKWGDDVRLTVAELGDGEPVAYPDEAFNRTVEDDHAAALVSVAWETVAHDPRLPWPDTMSVAADGHLYVTANQLHRQAKYQRGEDKRRKPYTLFRLRLGVRPVLLR